MNITDMVGLSATNLFLSILKNDKTGGSSKLEAEGDTEVLIVDVHIKLSTRPLVEVDNGQLNLFPESEEIH